MERSVNLVAGLYRVHRENRNPVGRGLAIEPADWKWSSYRQYALRVPAPETAKSVL